MAETIEAITRVDIPVVGHVGLTPQCGHRMGGHKVQGRASRLRGRRARAADRGRVRRRAGGRVRRRARGHAARPRGRDHRASCRSRRSASAPVPTATARCSCCTTCSGLSELPAKFAKRYAELAPAAIEAAEAYVGEVKERRVARRRALVPLTSATRRDLRARPRRARGDAGVDGAAPGRRAGASRSCRRWARCTTGTCSLIERPSATADASSCRSS